MKIEATNLTPKVILDSSNSILFFDGICAPENPNKFFSKIKELIDLSIKNNNKIWFDIHLEYFNTSAFKNLMDIFMSVSNSKINTKVIWRADEDDEELIESGEIIKNVTNIPLEIIKN